MSSIPTPPVQGSDLRIAAPPAPADAGAGAGAPAAPPAAWSPFSHPAFRWLWIATVVSNVGTWVHDVGAAWLMTSLAPSPLMVALVQTATTLPVLLFALPAGALADVFDRRRVLLFAQSWMVVSALALGLLTVYGGTTPWTLLALTFLLGVGTAMTAPAWQAIVPELVPRAELPAAVTLNSAGINVSRAVGPALGGLIVAAMGSGAAFLLNAVSFVGVLGALVWWKRSAPAATLPPERLGPALALGARYVRHNPRLLAVLVRTLAFIAFGSALWALLPLVARQELGTDALGYGIMLGAVGVGALAGTAFLPRLRGRLSADRMVAAASLLYAAVLLAAATVRSYSLLLPILLLGGAAWLTLLSTFQTGAQLTVPSWVRGRALAVYLMIFFGGQAGGALAWGGVAEFLGISMTLAVAAAGLVLTLLLVAVPFRLGTFEKLDLSPSRHWPALEPTLVDENEREDRPVLVAIEYRIDPSRTDEFRAAIGELRRERLRDGAVRWELFRDPAEPGRYVEHFVDPSWTEHLRHHERVTASDRDLQERVAAFHVGEGPPRVSHFVADGRHG